MEGKKRFSEVHSCSPVFIRCQECNIKGDPTHRIWEPSPWNWKGYEEREVQVYTAKTCASRFNSELRDLAKGPRSKISEINEGILSISGSGYFLRTGQEDDTNFLGETKRFILEPFSTTSILKTCYWNQHEIIFKLYFAHLMQMIQKYPQCYHWTS